MTMQWSYVKITYFYNKTWVFEEKEKGEQINISLNILDTVERILDYLQTYSFFNRLVALGFFSCKHNNHLLE